MTEPRSKALRFPRRSFWSFFGFTILGVSVTLYLFYWGWNKELEKYESQFHRSASVRAGFVKHKLDQCLLAVEALRSCFDASQKVESGEFETFSKPFLAQRKELQALEWIPRVSGNERARFEETMRKAVFPSYRITELDSQGQFLPAGVRKEYYPVTYIAPLNGNSNVIGFDVGSEPHRLTALERARDSGRASVTERIKVMQEDRKQSGFVVALPVYREGLPTGTVAQRRTALKGFVAGVFWAGDALTAALFDVTPVGLPFDLIDLSAPTDQQLLHRWKARLQAEPTWYSWLYPKLPMQQLEFDFADRRWEMAITPNLAYTKRYYSLAYWLVLPIGLALTFFMDLYLWMIASQRMRMEKTIQTRTAELLHYQENLEGLVQERAAEVFLTNQSLQKEIEERKKAEQSLHEHAKQLDCERAGLQAIFDTAQVGMLMLDETGEITRANNVIAEYLNKNPEDLLHRQPGDALGCIFSPTSPEGCGHTPACPQCPFRQAVSHVLKNGEKVLPMEFEQRIFADEGQRRCWFSLSASPVEIGGRRQVIVTLMDINGIKKTEALLHQSEEKLRLLLDSTAEAIYGVDLQGRCTFCNLSCIRMLGYESQDDLLGSNMHWKIHHSRADGKPFPVEECRIFQAHRVGKGTHVDDEVMWRADGTSIPVEYWSYPQQRGDQIVGSVVTFVDISERKRAEAELNKLSVAVEQSPAIIVITDRAGNIEYVNPKFCQMTGYTSDEARGKNPRILKSGETPPEAYKRLWDTILSGREWRGEFYNRKKNGEFYWEQALIAPTKDDRGKITNFIAVKEDITRRKADEKSLKEANEMLESLNQQLKKASEVKSRFLASMSHEIRTPLNAVIGMTGLLLDTQLDKEQRDDVETIRTSGEVLLSLINDILDFSKIEAEKLELENESFELARCLDEALDLVQYRAKEKKLKIGRRIESGVPKYIKGDVTRLRQILVNLLGNAVKFTDEGEVSLGVAGRFLAEGRWELRFTVRDTGPGIPPNRQDRLFQSFSQVDTSTNRRYAGTGLGLAISKRLCELMGGTMGVASSGVPGEGAEFHFTILAEPAAEPPPTATPAAADKEISLPPLRILLAEDNPINQKVAMKILKKIGCRADTAANGREVLEAVKQIPYDVILMDCQMPEMDGYEAARQIRSLEQLQGRKPIYIIAMTAHAMQGDRDECLAAGMDDYLAKPVREYELRAALHRCATNDDTERSSHKSAPEPTAEKGTILGGDAAATEPASSPTAEEADALPPGEELLDRESLGEDSDLSTEDLRELVEMYLEQAREIKKELKTSIEAGSAKNVRELAHKLAGSSTVCGASAMVSILRTLEQQGSEGRLTEADRLFAEFDRRLELTEHALKEYLADRTSAQA